MVIVGHAYVLLAQPGIPIVFQVSVSTYAVEIFFALSGFLVVKSWVSDPHMGRFLLKRAIRIIPGLIGVVLFTTLILGPIFTNLSLSEYFSHSLFQLYFLNIFFYVIYGLPGVFTENIYPNAVNGSLWSLPAEVSMYLLVLLSGVIFRLTFKVTWTLLTVLALAVNFGTFVLQWTIFDGVIVYATDMRAVAQVSPYFMVGGCLFLFKKWMPFRPSYTLVAVIVAYLLTLTGWPVQIFLIVLTSYWIISFGSYSVPVLRDFGRFGDLSYGVYLYGFPVAQWFSLVFGNSISVHAHIVLTLAVTFVLAFVSWHFIENRALNLKPSRRHSPTVPWAIAELSVSQLNEPVAVLLCTFNGERFLTEQLESILQQGHKNLRFWVSDDGSTDATMTILQQYQVRIGSDRFTIVEGPRRGFAYNFLSLLRRPEINADYYIFADQDDLWEAGKILRAVSLIEGAPSGLPVVYSGRTILIDEDNIEIGLSPMFIHPPSFRNAIIQSIGGGNTMVLNRAARDLVRRATVDTIVSHDWWIYMLSTGAGGFMVFDPIPQVRYRQHGRNIMGMNVGWRMKLHRFRMLFAGQLREWNDVNLHALQANRQLLTADSRSVFDRFATARKAGPIGRAIGLRRSGAYRQTVLDDFVVFLAALFKKI